MELEKLRWGTVHPIIEQRLRQILTSWLGTRYGERQCAKRGAVDCIRFNCAVYDELDGLSSRDHMKLPQDQALHSRTTAIAAMKIIRRAYMPNESVRDGSLEPGDQLTMAYVGGGPGHSMIAGPDCQLWHVDRSGVAPTGLVTPPRMKLVRIYRALNREERWVHSLSKS